MAYEVITLNLIPSGEVPVIHAAQFDKARPLMFALKLGDDDFDPSGYDLELQIRKVDNNIVTVAPASTLGNVVTFNSTEQMTACSGTNLGEIQITKGDLDIATLHFYLVVQRDVLAGGVSSASDIYNLTEQIADIVPEVIGDDYYNKKEVDEKIAEIPTFDPTNYYDKTEIDDKISEIPTFDPTNYYDKSKTDALLDDKANVSDLPDMTDYYTKSEVDTKITDLYQIKTASGDIAHFTDGGNNIPVKSFECAIGSTGFSQADITVCGKNVIDTRNIDTTTAGIHAWSDNNGFISLSGTRDTSTGWKVIKTFTDLPSGDYVFSSNSFLITCLVNYTNTPTTFTVNEGDVVRLALYYDIPSGTVVSESNIKVQIEVGDTATTYEVYNGNNYTVPFGSSFNDGVLKYENGAWYIDVSGIITPITSSTRVNTISGENNIFSSTGSCEVDYFTNTSDGIAELIKAFM